jgi:hypothetical protein
VEFNWFDVSTRELIWNDPAACLEPFGVGPLGPVEVIDCDITALTAAACWIASRLRFAMRAGCTMPAVQRLAGTGSGNLPNALQLCAYPAHWLVIDSHSLTYTTIADFWVSSQFPGDQFAHLGLCQLATV